MTDYAPLTSMICLDLAIGWQTCTDITIERRLIDGAIIKERTWNGHAEDLSDPAFNLMAFVIKSSGPGELRPPALDHIVRLPSFRCVPPMIIGDMIYVGETMRTLIRDPHPESVRILTSGFEDIPFTLDGRVIMLEAPATSVLRIHYQPDLELTAWDTYSHTEIENSKEVSWELPCQEVGGPDE